MKLENKVALVTGASRGIGKAISLALAKEGADLALIDLGNMDEVAQEVTALGRQVFCFQADISQEEQVKSAVDAILDKLKRVDILINNAGVTRDNLLLRMSVEEWETVININLKGAFLCTKAVSRVMLKQKSGRIVNIASVIGLMGNAGQANYAASKAGLIGFTKSCAKELASRQITVNAIAPGFIETQMTKGMSEDVRKALLELIPQKRLGQPEDVAKAVVFLASDDAAYITGEVVRVDGGMVM